LKVAGGLAIPSCVVRCSALSIFLLGKDFWLRCGIPLAPNGLACYSFNEAVEMLFLRNNAKVQVRFCKPPVVGSNSDNWLPTRLRNFSLLGG